MHENDPHKPKYDNEVSIRFNEGGRTFLHRVFRLNIDSGKPVVIRTQNESTIVYWEYQYQPGDETLEDGLTIKEGSDPVIEEAMLNEVKKFTLSIAITEGGYFKDQDGYIRAGLMAKLRRIRDSFGK